MARLVHRFHNPPLCFYRARLNRAVFGCRLMEGADLVLIFVVFVCLTGYLTWSLGGKKLAFPNLARRQWVVLNCALAIGAGALDLSGEYLPTVVTLCIAVFIWRSFTMYASLVELGNSDDATKSGNLD